MKNGITALLLMVLVPPMEIYAQAAVLHQDDQEAFERVIKSYDQGWYGNAAAEATRYINQYHDPACTQCLLETRLIQLKSKLRQQVPGRIEEILAFAESQRPGPLSHRAILLVADDAYARQDYDAAIEYFTRIDATALEPEERSGMYFKLGYSLFVRKEFAQAASLFQQHIDVRDRYFYPGNYYYGMTQYFMDRHAEAIRSFERVSTSDFYKDYVPYYITQIYFRQKQLDDVIGFGEKSLQTQTVQNKSEIHHLVGQAYFEKKDYAAAIRHLETVERSAVKWRSEDFYQLGITYYYTGRYQDAIRVWQEIRNEEGLKAQYANYYLGRCYLETGDKTSARNSLMRAAKMNDDPALAMEATLHFGRLAAEAGDDMEAILELRSIPSSSASYTEAQQTMAGILLNTADYSLAITEMQSMGALSAPMQEAYQKVTLYRGEQLLQEGKPDEAMVMMDKSLAYPRDKATEARACFWKGETAHAAARFDESIRWYDRYFNITKGNVDLPIHISPSIAHYNQGFNYIRLQKYTEAQKEFESALDLIRQMPPISGPSGFITSQVYPDAVLRAGDCAFKKNQYDRAQRFYNESIDKRFPGSDYAEYQNAIIKGLQGKPAQKIDLLEQLVRDLPQSVWADDALFQIGVTHQDEHQIPKALQAYERLVQKHNQSIWLQPALLRMGLLSYNAGQYETALVHYKEIFRHNPDPETAREAMSAIQEIYVNELDTPDAYFQYAASVPGFVVSGDQQDSIQYAAAENHYAQGDYTRAVTSFQKYVEAYPKGFYTLKAKYLKAESLTLLKRYDESLDAYEEVIKAGQSSYLATSLFKAATIAYHQKKDMARALTYYQRFIPLATDEEQQYEAIVGALRSAYSGNIPEEVKTVSDQLFTHPRATEDHKALAHFYLGRIAFDRSQDEVALTHFNAVVRVNSAEPAAESRYHIAMIYFRQGDTDLSGRLAEQAARENVGYPTWVAKSLLLLSDVHFKQGDLLNARAIAEAILENFEGDDTITREARDKLNAILQKESSSSRISTPSADTLELQPNPKKD